MQIEQEQIDQQEQAKFAELLAFAHKPWPKGKVATVTCACASEARSLRRKFYRMRAALAEESNLRKAADAITFRLQGRRIELQVQPDYTKNLDVADATYMTDETTGVPTDASIREHDRGDEQGMEVPASRGLDNPQ